MEEEKKKNIEPINNQDLFIKSFIDILNKKRVLYKYVFLFNNYKFKFKIVSTYYEYLMVCNNLLRDVTTCNLFYDRHIFYDMIGKSLYFPYILYIYEPETYNNINSSNFESIKFIKSSILNIEQIILKGKLKNQKYFKKNSKNLNNQKIYSFFNVQDINSEINNYYLPNKQKKIVGYVEIYLLFHMARLFDSRIERLVIHKEYRNKSLGLLIMYISIYLLKYIYHCNRCDLTVENEIALKLYKKLNFINVPTNVYRLNLYTNYNILSNNYSIQNDMENIQTFMYNINTKK
ncbi:conserved protein, unknown function [Plasmodium reichenowi]|uniref:N-acetyltransferase domain-containing protein n=1 Tax=Plasmodium reichenowi TaxID=5854 RepID=A0A060RV68_PLARE|nr:conserved protein, unknown function [Plasmodium reichenowi]KYO01169.1 conserved protein, unknown function [Plasmodium reichenowi]CDO63474.1 conserved protein, unknown function [Plasmodium reichenowi]